MENMEWHLIYDIEEKSSAQFSHFQGFDPRSELVIFRGNF